MYACMLSVFRDLSDGGYLNLDGLVAIVKEPPSGVAFILRPGRFITGV